MKKTLTLLSAALLSFSLSSCGNMNHEQTRAAQGAAGGALLGGIIGHQSGNALEGAALGGAVGGAGGYMYGRGEQ